MPESIIIASGKERLEDIFFKHHQSERQITTGDTFSAHQYVWGNAHTGGGEHRPRTAKTSNDFVADHEDVVFCANLANLGQPFRRRDNNSTDPLNRFGDKRANS